MGRGFKSSFRYQNIVLLLELNFFILGGNRITQKEIFDKILEKGYTIRKGEIFSPKGKKLATRLQMRKAKIPYQRIHMVIDRISVDIMIHRLVAYQKFGDKLFKEGIQARHKDGNSLNNLEENILIGTNSDNRMDTPKEVRIASAIKASYSNRRFTDKQVKNLLEDRKKGFTYHKLCEKYKTSKSTLSYLFNKALYSKSI